MFSDTRWRFLKLVGNFKLFAAAAIGFLLLIICLLASWPSGNPRYISGVVISTGPVSVSRLSGGTAEGVSIKLSDGRNVTVIRGSHSKLLHQGDSVRMIEQNSLFAPPAFGLVE